MKYLIVLMMVISWGWGAKFDLVHTNDPCTSPNVGEFISAGYRYCVYDSNDYSDSLVHTYGGSSHNEISWLQGKGGDLTDFVNMVNGYLGATYSLSDFLSNTPNKDKDPHYAYYLATGISTKPSVPTTPTGTASRSNDKNTIAGGGSLSRDLSASTLIEANKSQIQSLKNILLLIVPLVFVIVCIGIAFSRLVRMLRLAAKDDDDPGY